MPELQVVPVSNSQPKRRIQWTDDEWLLVARELYRKYPVDQLLRSSSLITLTLAQFLEAQKVLPENRRRNPAGIPTVGIVRPKLLQAFTVIRAEVDAELARKKAEDEAAAREAAYIPPPPMNAYEEAFAPLVNLIATKVAERMQDQLRQVVELLVPQAAGKLDFKNLPNVTGAVRPKIAVLGPLPVQQQDIKKAYPEVDFVMFEESLQATPDRLASCDFIIGMVDFIRHGAEWKIRDKFADKWRPVNGNVSAVKRLIGVLLSGMRHERQQQNATASLH